MSPTMIAALIGGGCGLITGIIGSLIAPWVNWGIEKRRKRFDSRQEVVRKSRVLIHDVSRYEIENDAVKKGLVFAEIVESHPHYFAVRPYLHPETRAAISDLHSELWGHEDVEPAFRKLVSNVDEIERKWGVG